MQDRAAAGFTWLFFDIYGIYIDPQEASFAVTVKAAKTEAGTVSGFP